mmetsp:Transcript_13462/g.21024  ORF Transcript_13462/g.21024 Transcript_13462/m.21024 type:complete len:102 (-) Transcript_13462:977-1282(-)
MQGHQPGIRIANDSEHPSGAVFIRRPKLLGLSEVRGREVCVISDLIPSSKDSTLLLGEGYLLPFTVNNLGLGNRYLHLITIQQTNLLLGAAMLLLLLVDDA